MLRKIHIMHSRVNLTDIQLETCHIVLHLKHAHTHFFLLILCEISPLLLYCQLETILRCLQKLQEASVLVIKL